MASPVQAWDVEQLVQMHLGFAPARILSSALELDVFSHLAAGNDTAAEVARAAGATERGIRMLMDALSGLGMLRKSASRYQLTDTAQKFLVRESPAYLGDFLDLERIWESWTHLTDAVRTGKPHSAVEDQAEAERFFPKLIRGLHVINGEPARRTVQVLGAGTTYHGLRVLDLACGSGVWSIAIAEADRDAHVTAQDFPGVLKHTREYLKRHGVENQYDFLPGNLTTVDLGQARYDVALLGNIVHSMGERPSRDLFRRVFAALKPGGRMLVIDMIANNDRSGPPFPLIFALNMLVNTEQGGTYTLDEYETWLKEAGFVRIETADIGLHSPLIIGFKG